MLTTAGILHWRIRGRRPSYALPAALLLFLFCWTPVSMLVLRAVQSAYPLQAPEPGDAGAIVILSGLVNDPFPPRPFALLGQNTLERCSYGAWYRQRAATLPVLVTGGNFTPGAEPYAVTMKTFLLRAGVPDSLIWTEERALSTAENSLYSARILREKGIRKIVLITDALHMRRAEKCFVKQGIAVVAAPCGFRPVYSLDLNDFLPSGRAIAWNQELLHEWIGLAWYRLRGVA